LFFSFLNLVSSGLDWLTILSLFNLFLGGNNWFALLVDNWFACSIFKLTFVVDNNDGFFLFLFFFENFRCFDDLFFSFLHLFSSGLDWFTILCLLNLFFGSSYWLSRFINDNFASSILKLTLIVDNNDRLIFFLFFFKSLRCFDDLFFSFLHLISSSLDWLTILCLFNLFFGSSYWLSRFINNWFARSIFKLTFIIDNNNIRFLFLLFFKNFRCSDNLLFSFLNLFSIYLHWFTILSLFDLFFGSSDWLSRFINDRFAISILKLSFIVD